MFLYLVINFIVVEQCALENNDIWLAEVTDGREITRILEGF